MLRSTAFLALLFITSCLSGQNNSPLRFIENKGQWPDEVLYRADLSGTTLWIKNGSVVIDLMDLDQIERYHQEEGTAGHGIPSPLNRHALELTFHGAEKAHEQKAQSRLPGYHNYYLGSDPSRWAQRAHAFGELLQRGIYRGVDLRIQGHGGYLKYDLIIAPGIDPSIISFSYKGAEKLALENGELIVDHGFGSFKETVPYAYQMVDGRLQEVQCRFRLRGDRVEFALGAYDMSKELVIDPTLVFSTFSGSTADNFGYTAAFDNDGFLYSGSSAFGQGYPTTTGAYQTVHGGGDGLGDGTDIAITKYDTTGTALMWSTFLGGSGDDLPHSLITNSSDECYVFGTTSSTDFPTSTTGYDTSFNGGTAIALTGLGVNYVNGSDMIVSRLSADGSALLSSTYLGGTGDDGINTAPSLRFNYADEVRGEILLDGNEDVLIVSCTYSTDIPIVGTPLQAISNGGQEGCVFKLNANLDAVLWSTFLGGVGDDALYAIDIAPNGELFVAGGTNSGGLPVSTNAVSPFNNGGIADAYLARLAPDGSSVLAGSYYGSVNYDQAYFIEADANGIPHIFGQTEAPGPNDLIQNAIYNIPNSGQMIAKFSPDFDNVIWSTRFGDGNGTPDISPTAFLVDVCNKIYIAGWGSPIQGGTLSTTGLLATANAYQVNTTGGDFFLAVYESDMSAVTYATFFGGPTSAEHVDGGTSRFDRRGTCYQSVCAGCGGNSDFPIKPNPGAWSATNNSANCNNGVFKFDFEAPLVIASFNAPDSICINSPITFDNTSTGASSYIWNFGDNNTSILAEPTHTYAGPGQYVVTLIANDPNACNLSDTAQFLVTVAGTTPNLTVNNDTIMCGMNSGLTLIASTNGSASNFLWSDMADLSNQINATLADSSVMVNPTSTTTYYVAAYNTFACAAIDSVVVTVSLNNVTISPDASICADDTIPLAVVGADPGSIFQWSPSSGIISGQGSSMIMVNPPFTTNYTVNITSPSNCTWSGSANVAVSQLNGSTVTANANPPIIQPGNSSQLNATPTNGVNYTWSPPGTLDDAFIFNPIATPSGDTWYTVVVTDGVCTASDSVLVRVREFNCDDPDIFVPNAFSPNGDNSNDVLFVRSGFITELEFKIFDRWGEKVFETNDIAEGWDGTYKGKPVDPAVFVYYLDAVCADGQTFFQKGNVTVVE